MSMIVHRCTICGHNNMFKRDTQCCAGQCSAGPHKPKFGPSEVIPTFDGMGARIASITKPGGLWVGAPTCDCKDCSALYDALGGVAA